MDVGSSSGMLLTNGLQWRDTFSLLRVMTMMRTRGVVMGGIKHSSFMERFIATSTVN